MWPLANLRPAFGAWWMTFPRRRREECFLVTLPTRQWCRLIATFALASVLPTTRGTDAPAAVEVAAVVEVAVEVVVVVAEAEVAEAAEAVAEVAAVEAVAEAEAEVAAEAVAEAAATGDV